MRSESHEFIASAATTESVDVSNLPACTEEVRRAALDMDHGPADTLDFDELRARLTISRDRLPPLYREAFADPFLQTIQSLGPHGFQKTLLRDPDRTRAAGLMLDIAHAILQNGEGFQPRATDAFQEVVSDLYDGFLSAADRRGVAPPDRGTTPPLVKWGNPDFGPYTWPADATRNFKVQAAVVSLPPSSARKGLLAWSALAHETAGHDILHADTGLEEAISTAVLKQLSDAGLPDLGDYWSDRMDETASDILGILNMGPAAGIGLIGYFRGLNAAAGGRPRLRNDGGARDVHPADILRGFLAAETVRLLSFSQRNAWGDAIEAETRRDLGAIRLAGRRVSEADAIRSAKIVAEVVVTNRWAALENHAFSEIQNWRDHDEGIVREIRRTLSSLAPLPEGVSDGFFAAHVVAAATYSAIAVNGDLALLFERMLGSLKVMHDANPSWGPLFVRHAGSIRREFIFHRAVIGQWSCSEARRIAREEANTDDLNKTLFDAGLQTDIQRQNYIDNCAGRAREEFGRCVSGLPSAPDTKVRQVGDKMCDTGVPCD